MSVATAPVSFEVRDVSGQRTATVNDCPGDVTISEVMPQIVATMCMSTSDASGNTLTYSLRRDSDGAILHGEDSAETIAGEKLVLQPSVEAGAGR